MMADMSKSDDRFNLEVLKLLLQVAWSDLELDRREADLVLGIGRSWFVPEEELEVLEALLRAGGPLPAPDLAFLRTRKQEVLEAAQAIVLADGHFADDEEEMLQQIRELLQLPAR
jgi:tellurite resistance protein